MAFVRPRSAGFVAKRCALAARKQPHPLWRGVMRLSTQGSHPRIAVLDQVYRLLTSQSRCSSHRTAHVQLRIAVRTGSAHKVSSGQISVAAEKES